MTRTSLTLVLSSVLGLAAVAAPHEAPEGPRGRPAGQDEFRTVEVPRRPLVLEGFVLDVDGTPAPGAMVVSSAGGRATADPQGRFSLEVEVPLEADTLQVTAVGGVGSSRLASVALPLSAVSGVAGIGTLQLSSGGSCEPSWMPTGRGFVEHVVDIEALAAFDGGSGPRLYAATSVFRRGRYIARTLARWNGSTWVALPGEPNGPVHSLVVYDDGSGPALYAGGDFTSAGGVAANHIARWDGVQWSPVGTGTDDEVRALAVHDDGGGPALFAGGRFLVAGGNDASLVARWDGAAWTPLGPGLYGGALSDKVVHVLTTYDDGSGPALYAGGDFTTAGPGVSAKRIARWDGTSWSDVGGGVAGAGVGENVVLAMTVYDDGGGEDLYVGGTFLTAGGVAVKHLARWDGATWSDVGGGVNGSGPVSVRALAAFDRGPDRILAVGGEFDRQGSSTHLRPNLAVWNGSFFDWFDEGFAYPLRIPVLNAMHVWDDGSGPTCYAGGEDVLLRWSRWNWLVLGKGPVQAPDHPITGMAGIDVGQGEALYVGGDFKVGRPSIWDGEYWLPVDAGVSGVPDVTCFAEFDGTAYVGTAYNGLGLYAIEEGGSYLVGGGLGGLFQGGIFNLEYGNVWDLEVFDDGSGPALYVGGEFWTAGGASSGSLVRWNGSTWSSVFTSSSSTVYALEVFDDGTGPALFACGASSGTLPGRIGKWDGTSWSNLGSGLDATAFSMAVHDDGTGPALYVAGSFTTAGGVPANHIAKWDGTSWSALGGGIEGVYAFLYSLASFDPGSGPELYVSAVTVAGGMAVNGIARWDGTTWSPLGSGVDGGRIDTMAVHDDGRGSFLWVGGTFTSAGGLDRRYLGRWGCDRLPPRIFAPDSVTALERPGSAPGEVVHFVVTATDDLDPAPTVVCVPPSGSLFAFGTTLVTCTATDAAGNQSMVQFPVIVQPKAVQAGF